MNNYGSAHAGLIKGLEVMSAQFFRESATVPLDLVPEAAIATARKTERGQLLYGVVSNPFDEAPAGILADWWEEHGDERTARMYRALTRSPGDPKKMRRIRHDYPRGLSRWYGELGGGDGPAEMWGGTWEDFRLDTAYGLFLVHPIRRLVLCDACPLWSSRVMDPQGLVAYFWARGPVARGDPNVSGELRAEGMEPDVGTTSSLAGEVVPAWAWRWLDPAGWVNAGLGQHVPVSVGGEPAYWVGFGGVDRPYVALGRALIDLGRAASGLPRLAWEEDLHSYSFANVWISSYARWHDRARYGDGKLSVPLHTCPKPLPASHPDLDNLSSGRG